MGPVCYGPTGPQQTFVFAVPTGGTHINLDEPRFALMQESAKVGTPWSLGAEQTNVAYMWALVGSGLRADPTATVFAGATTMNPMNQCGVIFANTRVDQPEFMPNGVKGLVITSYGGNGGTGMLRMWKIG